VAAHLFLGRRATLLVDRRSVQPAQEPLRLERRLAANPPSLALLDPDPVDQLCRAAGVGFAEQRRDSGPGHTLSLAPSATDHRRTGEAGSDQNFC